MSACKSSVVSRDLLCYAHAHARAIPLLFTFHISHVFFEIMSRIELLTWVICVDVKRCTHWKLTFTMLSSFSFSYHVRCSFIHSFFRSFFSLAAASIQVSVPVFRQDVSSPGISQAINADDNFCWYLLFEIYILSCTTASTTLKSVVFYIRCGDFRCRVLYLIFVFILSLTSEFEILFVDRCTSYIANPPSTDDRGPCLTWVLQLHLR